MSEVPSNTPKRQAIVERLRQRIDCFRKRHDSCQARLEETQPSRELKQLQESRIFQSKILENKVKMTAKIRPEQISKLVKQEDMSSSNTTDSKQAAAASAAASSNNITLQATVKRKFQNSLLESERGLQGINDDMSTAPVPQKYARFENDVHCNVKPAQQQQQQPNFNAAEDPEMSNLASNNMSYGGVNGHASEFVKTEDHANTASSYNTSACENLERTMQARTGQQYGSAAADFPSPTTFTSRGQSGEKLRNTEFSGTFKQENGLLSPSNDSSSSMANGLLPARTKSEDDFRLLTDIDSNMSTSSKEDDLENQLSQFERVLQGIKSRDESSNESEPSNDMIAAKTQILRAQSQQPLGNGLNDSPDNMSAAAAKVNSNQLNLTNDPNNPTVLPTSIASAVHQQYGISRTTAQVLQQFVNSKARFERNHLFLNPQGPPEQNSPRMAATQRGPNHFPAVRQRVYQQLQQRKNLQLQKSKIAGAASQQLQPRNPVLNPLAGNPAYQMHTKVRYSGISPSAQQTVSSFTHAAAASGRIHPNLMQPLRAPVNLQQTQAQGQMPGQIPGQIPGQMQGQMQGQIPNLPRHQINLLAQQQQQQKLAFQQQMASRLPSYSQAQHLARSSSSVMDIRQKYPAGVPSTHSTQYNPMHQQATRAQQPLSHLQHYNPPGYGNQSGLPVRPVQVPYSGDFPGYGQHPYQYGVNQENKLHSAYQRHASMDDNMVAVNRFHTPADVVNNRNSFAFQRSSSLPAHAVVGPNNLFNQTSSPVVRLGQNDGSLPDMNNNGNDHPSQDMSRIHPPQAPLSHMKQQHHTNNLSMNQEQLYQGNGMSLAAAQGRPQPPPPSNLQTPLPNSFSNLLDMKSNSETSLFPFLGQDLSGGPSDSTDFDSLLKSPPSDFDLLNMLESESAKALQ